MNEISPQQLLAQIRTLNRELQGSVASPEKTGEAAGFGDFLKTAIDSVNASQKTAAALKRDFESERNNADLTQVMVAVQKADLSFRAMTEVRNKLVSAYQEIMNMPV
jgi:flagellar hook-basal body complex protein FliE